MKYLAVYFYMIFFCSCLTNNQEYQKNIIDLKKLDFNTFNTEDFYRNANKDENLKISNNNQYVEISDFDNGWVEFQIKKSSDNNIVAKFDSINFSTLNAIASKNGKLKIINAETYLKPERLNKLYLNIKGVYGKETKTDSSDYNKYVHIYTYTWDVKDRIIKLISIFDPRSSENLKKINAKIPVQDSKIVNERPKTILFVCNKESLKDVLKLNNTDNNWAKFK